MKPRQAFTLVEYLVVACAIAVLIGVLLPDISASQGASDGASLARLGLPLPPDLASGDAGSTPRGSASNTHRWIPINGQYFGGDLVLSPDDVLTKWTGGNVTTVNFSFAALPIEDQSGAGDQAQR